MTCRSDRSGRAVLCVAFLALSTPALADSLDAQLGPRTIALGDSMRGDARGAQSIALNPSGLPGNTELSFEGSYGYGFHDGASIVSASGCDSTNPVPGCFYYRYFTASPEIEGSELSRRAHEGGGTLSRALSRRLFAGVNIKYFDYESTVPGEEDSSGFTVDAGATLMLMPQLRLGLVGHHLFGKQSVHYPRALGTGMVFRPLPQLSLSFDALWRLERPEGESTGRYGGGIEYFLQSSDRQSGYPIRLGAVHDVAKSGTYVGGGLGFMAAKVGLDVALKRQVSGGDEMILQASLRIFGPRPTRAGRFR